MQKFGKFLGNKKLYDAETRKFFQNEDPFLPGGHEPDWTKVVAGPPQSDNSAILKQMQDEGMVGLYERLPESKIEIIADDDPRRNAGLHILLLKASTPYELSLAGIPMDHSFAISASIEHLVASSLE